MTIKRHSGQVALIMVLIMTVISAIAVSVAGRSTAETRTQQMSVESSEAILTAQAGLEMAVSQNSPATGSLGTGKNYSVTLGDTGTTSILTDKINPGEVYEVVITGSSGLTGVRIYWNAVVTGERPSIFVTEVKSDRSNDFAFDTDGTGGFTRVTSGGVLSGANFTYVIPNPITVDSNTTSIRVTVLGSAAFLGIEPVGGVFPAQMTVYRSVADLTSGDASVKYGLEYSQSKTNLLPSVFDYVLFSGGSIIQ